MYQKLVLFSGFIFSLLFHGAIFYWLSGDKQVISAKSVKQSSTTISLCVPAPKEIKKKANEPKSKPEKAKKKPKKPKKKLKPEHKPEEKKIPVPKPIVEKKLFEEETNEELIEEKTVEEVVEQVSSSSHKTAKSQISTDELEARKNIFLQELRETIKRNKTYPRIARRRGIQGEVTLQFDVLSDGSLVNVDIISGKKVFHRAVKEAIERSSPAFNVSDIFSYPLEVSLKISFRLK